MASGRLRILVVDDDADVGRAVGRLLAQAGLDVVVFSRPADALASEGEVHGAVLDICMAELDGVALYERLRRRWPGLPALFLTGGCPLALRERAAALAPVLPKPFDCRTIVAAVRAMLDGGTDGSIAST
jgi:DNA-binding response OmpR family regulator